MIQCRRHMCSRCQMPVMFSTDGVPAVCADARLQEMLSSRYGTRQRKSVRWPDQVPDDDEDAAFRIGRPRQLEIVHLIPDLGPDSPVSSSADGTPASHMSFAAAVRAEHSGEKHAMLRNGSNDMS